MADIDTSTYPKLNPQQNPLQTLSGFATLQNTLNQNKLFQQDFNSRLGMSRIYKEAIDPATGQLDVNKLRGLMSDPNVTLGLPQAFQQSQEAQQRNISIDSAQLENTRKHLDALSGYITPLLKAGSTSRDVAAALSHAQSVGLAGPQALTNIWSTLPRNPQTGQIDESQIPAWAQQQQLNVMTVQERLNAMSPAPTMQDLPGGGKAPFVMPQIGQVQQVGPTIQPAPPPTQTYTDPSGVPRYFGNVQGGNPYAPSSAAAPTPAAAPGASAGAPGVQSGAATPIPGPGGQQAPVGNNNVAPGGNIAGIPAGMSPAASQASGVSGHDSATQLAALRGEVGGSANRILQLQNASTALEGALTGKGSQKIQDLQSLLVTSGLATQGQAQSVKNFDEAKKYMLGSMLSRGAGLGINTNEKLAALSGASPNTDISQLAAKDIIRTNIGLEKAQQTQYSAFQKTGLPPEQFADWAANWNKERDLRAYPLMQKPVAERTAFLATLKPAEKARIVQTIREGINLGTLPVSDFAK